MPRKMVICSELSALMILVGCSAGPAHRHELDQFGEVYYLDGAGGGSVLTNWGGGVQSGLKAAGYPGDFNSFVWNTGLGVGADQSAGVEYKREQARKLALRIQNYMDEHPDRPVNLIGLSAGTAVAVFTLEALSVDRPVDTVVLLGSSISSHYDMTQALRHVRGRVHVFTSERDAVLGVAVAVAGTADRQFCGACSAGLRGFHVPPSPSDETKRLYSKIENVAWRPEFAGAGNLGGHTDAVNTTFVRQYVAPLLLREGPRFVEAGVQPALDKPDDARG